MERLYCINISFYFKVIDSEMFGGQGSEGYTSVGFEDCDLEAIVSETIETFGESQRKTTADMLNVPVENVVLISKAEYDKACGEYICDDDYHDDDYDY